MCNKKAEYAERSRSEKEIEQEIAERLTRHGVSPETLAGELARLGRAVGAVAGRLTVLEIARMGEAKTAVERPNIGNLRRVIAERPPGEFVLLTREEATHLCDYIEHLERGAR